MYSCEYFTALVHSLWDSIYKVHNFRVFSLSFHQEFKTKKTKKKNETDGSQFHYFGTVNVKFQTYSKSNDNYCSLITSTLTWNVFIVDVWSCDTQSIRFLINCTCNECNKRTTQKDKQLTTRAHFPQQQQNFFGRILLLQSIKDPIIVIYWLRATVSWPHF